MTSYTVFDLETSTYTSFKRQSNPFDSRNKIVACGWKKTGDGMPSTLHLNDYDDPAENLMWNLDDQDSFKPDILVGFNIKFDLLYIWNRMELQTWIEDGGKIWDCMLAEYMLSGQTDVMPSLDETAPRYGGTLKDNRIKLLWESGCATEDIPKDMLIEYLENDVINTELVYLGQLERLKDKPKLKRLIELQMDALLGTTEMEFNGMKVDQQELQTAKAKLEIDLIELDAALYEETKEYNTEINFDSPQQLSKLFFGGTIKKPVREAMLNEEGEPVLFKTGVKKGQVKEHWVDHIITLPQLVKPLDKWAGKIPGMYSVDEATLSILAQRPKTKAGKIANLLLERRGLSKKLGTYFTGMQELIQPDGCIHPSLNHCVTITGRLSSSNPNMQNIPRDDNTEHNVKSMFVSRYENGHIIDIDFGGIEVVAAAFLSQDEQMIYDLLTKPEGPHKENAAVIYNKPVAEVTKEERQSAKVGSFQLLYGASAGRIAEITFGGDVDMARSFVDRYYANYPQLKEWQEAMLKIVDSQKQFNKMYMTMQGRPAAYSQFNSITGRIYTFIEKDSPDFLKEKKGIMTSISPTEVKNYPVQGFATADIVLIMLGKLYRKLCSERTKCLLVNTVHDSVVIDCRPEHLTTVKKCAKLVLEDVKSVLKENFNIDFNVPLKVEIKSGYRWGENRNDNRRTECSEGGVN